MELISEIEKEISRLSSSVYRREEGIWAESKQLRQLTKLLSVAKHLKKSAVLNFTRVVNDIAPRESRLSKLSTELYKVAED